jgi:hypothetical protein
MPELMQLDSGKSMIRNLPPKYSAGFARQSVSSCRRDEPAYKARIFHGGLVDHVTVPPQSIIVKSGRRVHRDRPEVAQ